MTIEYYPNIYLINGIYYKAFDKRNSWGDSYTRLRKVEIGKRGRFTFTKSTRTYDVPYWAHPLQDHIYCSVDDKYEYVPPIIRKIRMMSKRFEERNNVVAI